MGYHVFYWFNNIPTQAWGPKYKYKIPTFTFTFNSVIINFQFQFHIPSLSRVKKVSMHLSSPQVDFSQISLFRKTEIENDWDFSLLALKINVLDGNPINFDKH